MKRLLRLFLLLAAVKLSLISLLMGLTHLLRVRSSRGMALRTFKSLAEALAEPLTAAGATGALVAARLDSPGTAAAGLLGALLSGIYLLRLNATRADYARAFGRTNRLRRKQQPAAPADPVWLRDVVYHAPRGMQDQTLPPLHCDLWQPGDLKRSGIALIYIHGGGYFSSRKDFGTRGFFRHLTRQGHVVMDIDYRLAPRADFFEMFSDVLHAVDWMKRNAEDLGADPEKIVLVGGSAGAHLALLAAYAHHELRLTPLDLQEADLAVRGVISYYGIIDLTSAFRSIQRFASGRNQVKRAVMGMNTGSLLEHPLAELFVQAGAWVRGVDLPAMREYLRENEDLLIAGPEIPMQTLLGGTPDEIPEVYGLVSPITHAGPGCPPTLLFQGAHDYLLPLEPARALHQKLRDAGVPSVYVELPQTEHTFDLFLAQISPPARVALRHVDRFLGMLDDPPAGVVQ